MRSAWRLATSSFSGRVGRSALLVAAVALSAALVTAVSSAMASVTASVQDRLLATLGEADLRFQTAGKNAALDAEWMARAAGWPETERVIGLRRSAIGLAVDLPVLVETKPDGQDSPTWEPGSERVVSSALLTEIAGDDPWSVQPLDLIAGRLPDAPGELVIDALLAQRLSWDYANRKREELAAAGRALRGFGVADLENPRTLTERPGLPATAGNREQASEINAGMRLVLGDMLNEVRLFGTRRTWTVVGVSRQPPLGGRPQAFAVLPESDAPVVLSELSIVLRPDAPPAGEVAERYQQELPENLILQPTAKVSSGLDKNLASSRLGFLLASVLAYLSASFIVLTAMSTDVVQRQRELAMLRCIGAGRGTMATAQLLTGLIVGLLGAVLGAPLGIGLAWLLVRAVEEHVPGGLVIAPAFVAVSVVGSILAGVVGAALPAYRVATISPLEAMVLRSRPVTERGLHLTLLAALICIGTMVALLTLPSNGQVVFWAYATVGLPAMFVGYFLLSVPVTRAIAAVFARPLEVVLRLPPRLLSRQVARAPYRYGFTAGAMMAGLGLMVAIWTQGGGVMRDWLDKITFPDAFVSGLALTEDALQRVADLPFVEDTCAIALQPVETDAFGIRSLQQYRTTFVAFEPEPFFRMTTLAWDEGDPETARQRLIEGGAVIVAREFRTARGLGVGDTFACTHEGREFSFDIVGVVGSPGLELVSKFFNVGDEFTEQSLHAVFGSRKDLRERFGSDAIQLIQIDLVDDADDAEAVAAIREATLGAGVLDAGSGRQIKQEIERFVGGSLLAFSAVAVISMLIASFGVANLIAASVQGRKFELGVLRAVGAQRGAIGRLVMGEAVLIALSAGLLGTMIGLQGAWAGQRMYALLIGLDVRLVPPWGAICVGWGFVAAITLLAALPAAASVTRRATRELLASRN